MKNPPSEVKCNGSCCKKNSCYLTCPCHKESPVSQSEGLDSSWHFWRECHNCGFAGNCFLHCLHDKYQNNCPRCDEKMPSIDGDCECEFVSTNDEISTTLTTLVKKMEGLKKSGVHEFEVGFPNCKHCNEPRIIVDKQFKNRIVDEKTGGSSQEVTVMEYNTTGHPCSKNVGSQFNAGISAAVEVVKKMGTSAP